MKKFVKISPLALACVVFASAEVALVSSASAVPVAATAQAQQVVTVAVPAGETLTYTLDGQTVQVAGGQSVVLPAGATNVFFPQGSVVTLKRAAVAKPYTYTVSEGVTLAKLTKTEFTKFSEKFVYNHVPGTKRQDGSKIETVFVNPTTQDGNPGTDSNT